MAELCLDVETRGKLAPALHETVQRLEVYLQLVLAEAALEVLEAEVLVDLRLAVLEETADFLNARLVDEGLAVLALDAGVRVVAHQILREEDGGVEALLDSRIDGHLSALQTDDLLRQCLEAWHKYRVDLACKVNVEVFAGFRVWQRDGRCNGPQQRFGELSLLVIVADVFFNLLN